jgi:hypothetical protein
LNKEQYEGEKLAVIVKMDNKSIIEIEGVGEKSSEKEIEGFGEKLNEKEIKEVSDFFKKQLEKNTDMIIVNEENILNNNKDYHRETIQKKIKQKYGLDFLFIVNLSNITFNYSEQVNGLTSETYSLPTSEFDSPNETKKEVEGERYEYGCSVRVAYQIIDLQKNESIYSGEGGNYYKTSIDYASKMRLLEKAIIGALEETKLIKEIM